MLRGVHYLIPVSGSSPKQIDVALLELERAIQAGQALRSFVRPAESARTVLVCGSPTEALREVQLCRRVVLRAFAEARAFRTPGGSTVNGSAFPAQGVTFVYGGIGSGYPGWALGLDHWFPSSFAWLRSEVGSIAPLLDSDLGVGQASHASERTNAGLDDVTRSQIAAVVLTRILRQDFGVEPEFAFGFSLGEWSMLASLGAWTELRALAELTNSDTYVQHLGGALASARRAWAIPVSESPNWTHLLIWTDQARLEAAAKRYRRLYVTERCSPTQLMIAGEPAQCRALAAELGARSVEIPVPLIAHCPPAMAHLEGIERSLRIPARALESTQLVFHNPDPRGEQVSIEARYARQVAISSASFFDFPWLVRRVYAAGARIFVEAGARNSALTWIEEILAKQSFAALATNIASLSPIESLARCIGALIAYGVPVQHRGVLQLAGEASH